MLKTITRALAGAALLTAGTVSAEERDTRTIGVTYQDLDLATDAGRDELERRIDNAARQVCGMNERAVGSNIVTRESRDCYRSAKRDLDHHFARIVAEQTSAG